MTYYNSSNSPIAKANLGSKTLEIFYSNSLNPFLVFTYLQYKSFENTVGKGEIAHKEQFLLFSQCFLPI